MKKTLLGILLLLNGLLIFATALCYLSVYIPPDKFWPPAFFGMAFPGLVLANLLFIILWIFVKPKNLFISLLAVLLGSGFIMRYFQLKGDNRDSDGIRVVSYNVRLFQGYDNKDLKENARNIVAFLNDLQPDIICLQDARLRVRSVFDLRNTVKDLSSVEHYQYASSASTLGLITMTRFRIIMMKEVRFENTGNMAIYTDVVNGSDTIRIFNIHLQSYKIDPEKYSVIGSPGIDSEKDLKEIREMGGKLKRAFQKRAVQVREIRRLIDESPYPVIVCGDFNDTPVSYSYQKIRGDLKDAFVCSGSGFGGTYIGKLPSFRIDNIFHSDDFESFNFRTNNFKMSDHLPVSCTLVLKKD